MSFRLRGPLVLIAMLAVALALPAAQQDRTRTEAELKALKNRIERVQQQVQKDTVEKNRQARALRDAEREVSKAQGELSRLREQRRERAQTLEKLAAERAQREAERDRTADDLARQLRAAYFMGRSEPFKLLLNQRSPAEFSRNLAYYGYLGRLRADQIDKIKQNIVDIESITATIEAEEAELARLEQQQQERVGELDSARTRRTQVLASLNRESRDRNATLQRMRQERQSLERLVEQLRRATEALPYDPNAPFARTRGRLHWPVAGKIALNYGATIPGLGKSEGIEIDTKGAVNVAAIHEGRIIYADWHPARGQLIILDHGNGYWSVYGHLAQMFRGQDATVKAGEVIGTSGDSGGRERTGLYFEIRRNKNTVDPRGWFRSAAPPAG